MTGRSKFFTHFKLSDKNIELELYQYQYLEAQPGGNN
jgi:hypothetical protein